jgi:Alg9-like mannosyltransferase family
VHRIGRLLETTAAALLDVLIVVALLVIAFVLVTGGGVYVVGGARISIRSADNALLLLLLAACLRLASLHWCPLFGHRRLDSEFLERRAGSLVTAWRTWAASLPPARATRLVLIAAAAALLVKAYLASTNPGFFSGDDVEIHEMTLGYLLRHPWPIWELRSPVYPFVFVFPSQRLAVQLGVADVGRLVIAGRLMVAGLSTVAIWLAWRIARRQHEDAIGIAVTVAALFAAARLQIAFGSSELPRPVSTVFVLLAFLLLMRASMLRCLLAGAVLGVAASLRFSEAVFLVPAGLQLLLHRRVVPALAMTVSAVAVLGLLLGAGDQLYWGQAFHSLTAATDYTLVHQLSSRGYQPWWWYVGYAGQWVSLPLLPLAAIGVRRGAVTALWVAVPIVFLSALPHKEARYAIPVVPFVYLLAGYGVRTTMDAWSRESVPRRAAPALLAGLGIGLLMDVSHYRLPRSNAEIATGERVRGQVRETTRFAVEQLWRMGGHLYFGDRSVTDLDPGQLGDTSYLARELKGDTCVALDRRTLRAHPELATLLERAAYTPLELPADSPYAAWISPR